MKNRCGCCEGTEKLTPAATANRPGLNALTYRAGTHATFLETMKARLAGFYLEMPDEFEPDKDPARIYPLNGLATRQSDDPAISLLDAWATVGDVLTFYQERIANEGYLRTATERRSVLELARLIDYSMRPGVSANAFLALTLEKGHSMKLKPGEIRAQSLPGPGELPQTFENSEPLEARAEWNILGPRMSRPQTQDSIEIMHREDGLHRIYLKGTSTGLAKNDPLLIDFGNAEPILFRVMEVIPDTPADRTLVKFQYWIRRARRAGVEALQATLAQLIDKASKLSGKTAQFFLTRLVRLNNEIDLDPASSSLRDRTIVTLTELKNFTLPKNATKLAVLRDEIVTELKRAADNVTAESIDPRPDTPISEDLSEVIAALVKPASVPPANSLQLSQALETSFGPSADTGLQLLGAFQPTLRGRVQTAVSNVPATKPNPLRAYALRAKAAPFGHNAPPLSKTTQTQERDDPANADNNLTTGFRMIATVEVTERPDTEIVQTEGLEPFQGSSTIFLDGSNEKLLPDSWVVIDTSSVETSDDADPKKGSGVGPVEPSSTLMFARATTSQANLSRAAYGMSGPATRLDLVNPVNRKSQLWISLLDKAKTGNFQMIRRTVVYTQSEELALAEEPIDLPICDGTGEDGEIELDALYSELKAGRWLIISGERGDIAVNDSRDADLVAGIRASELAMLAEVRHGVLLVGEARGFQDGLPGDVTHTFIKLAKKLEYCYKRDSVTIYGNVVKGNHGETRNEALGGGDATKAFQSFTLRQPPLTYVASPTPAGADSTLKVYVNDVEWTETDTLADLTPTDRKFVTRTDDESKTTIVFGNGDRGARLPTGLDNIRAVYRNGIGKAGNVVAGQISQLMTRPLGVKDVINPLRASGGADQESRDSARKNAPLTVTALDRLISTDDYADFARTFAGIGKSVAARFSDGRRQLVHVTIAGSDDIPIDESSDLFRNLTQALRKFGDAFLPLKVEVRELMFLVLSAGIRILPGYLWEPVVRDVRLRLLDAFGFERRELGQDALLSEAISAVQTVRGVSYVDVDVFGGVAEKRVDNGVRRLQTPNEIIEEVRKLSAPDPRVPVNLAGVDDGVMHPAQLAYLTPDVPATLILNQI